MHRSRTEDILGLDKKQQWERDRQIVLAQLHNLMLALRSNTKFSSKMRFVQAAMEPQHHLMVLVKNLRESLFSPQMEELAEEEILKPFCEVALSEETTEPITGVALAAFVTFLDLKCSFLTKDSLIRLSDCASNSRSEIADAQSHEAVLARILQVYVGCARHPAAHELEERHIIGMLERAYAVSTHGDPSELLRRTAEQAMNDIVTAAFYRIVEECAAAGQNNTFAGKVALTDTSPHSDESPLGRPGSHHDVPNRGGSLQVRSGASIIEYICKLIVCRVTLPSSQQSAAVSVAAVQLQGLCLAHTALFILKDALRLPLCLPLLRYVRNDLCRALLSIGTRTDNIIVLSQLLRTAHLVVQFASVTVVPQALSIIKGIHLTPMLAAMDGSQRNGGAGGRTPLSGSAPPYFANSNPIALDDMETREMHEMLIESLLEFCSHHSFGTFCFVHYDLSLHYPPLLDQLAHFLARNCFHHNHHQGSAQPASPAPRSGSAGVGSSPTSPLPALAPSNGAGGAHPSQTASLRLNQINILAFDSLMGLLMSLAERVEGDEASTACNNSDADAIRQAIEAKLLHKREIMSFAEKFAADPLKEGVRSYIASHPNPGSITGWEVGEFLFEHRAVLDKNVLGEYLGELGKEPLKPDSADTEATAAWEAARVDDFRKPGTVRFFEKQLRGFLHGFQFEGKELLTSIREMVFQMRLPGEAQKIDRVMQAFAEHWYACNQREGGNTHEGGVNPFRSEDAAFILSFSIIMLNTDLHSGKLDKTMTMEQFRCMNRGIDNGQNVPDTYLDAVYHAVKGEQIIMIDMVREGHAYDAVWKMEMAEAKQQAHDSLLAVGMRGNSAPDLRPFDPFVFQTLWRPMLLGLTSVFEGCSAQFTLDKHHHPSLLTLTDLHNFLKRRYGKDYAVFECSVRGLRTLVRLGSAFGVPEAVDRTVITLLRHVPFSLQNGYSNLQMLGRSPSTLIAVQELFQLIFTHSDAMQESWSDVASFLHKSFLLGMFSRNWGLPAPADASPPLDASIDSANASIRVRSYSEAISDQDPLEGISPVLLCNPGIVGPQSMRLQMQQAEGNGSWFGGWFASSSQSESKRKEREIEDHATLQRITGTFPHVQTVLDAASNMSDAAFVALVDALCHSECTVGDTPAGSYAASYALHFTLEVVVRDLRRVELVESLLLGYVREQLGVVFQHYEAALEASQQASATSLSALSSARTTTHQHNTHSATRAVATMEHWRSTASRMTDAVLRLVCVLSRYPKHHPAMLHLLAVLVELPPAIFTSVVAQPMSVALYMSVVERSEVQGVLTLSTSDAWNQFLYVVHIVGVLAPYAEVRARMIAVLLSITKTGTYDVLGNSQRLAHALIGNVLAPPILSQEVPQDWMSINSFDATPYVSVQTPLRSTKDLDLHALEECIPEALVVAYKRVVALCRDGKPWVNGAQQQQQDGGAAGGGTPWYSAWMFILSGFVTFVVSARQQRVASDSLLCLQRCVLDTDLLGLPLTAVLDLMYQLLFPLTEKLCVPAGAASSGGDSAPSGFTPSSTITPSKGGSASSALSLLSPSVLMSTVFGPLAGPTERRAGQEHGAGDSTAATGGGAPSPAALHVSEEMQCRAISLLPKVFLHYLYIIAKTSNPAGGQPACSALEVLWKRLLGTLYAMYTASVHQYASKNHDDAGMLREAIQENVKNLIYVLTATVQVSEHQGLLSKHPLFWPATVELLKPFDFGAALVQHLKGSGFV